MTVGSAVTPEVMWRDGLPPDEYWAIDPSKILQTPVDSRGLIIVDELIERVKAYICPEYDWDGPGDIHHLYFYASRYWQAEQDSGGAVPAHRFREMPVNKVLVPRRFHNVIHAVTEPAEMPGSEVMRNYIDAWTAARNLFASVRSAVQAERRTRRWLDQHQADNSLTPEQEEVGLEIMEETILRHFKGISRHLGALSLLPEEYRPFSTEVSLRDAMGQLGDILLHGRQRQTRAARLPLAKPRPCTCLRCKANRSIITSVIN
jgi:hypothetical protein